MRPESVSVVPVKKLSLRYKIVFLFTLAILLPALLFSLVLTGISRRAIRTSIFSQQQEIVNRVADRINAQIELHQKLLLANNDIWRQTLDGQVKTARDILAQGSAFTEVSLLNVVGREQWRYTRSDGTVFAYSGRRIRNASAMLTGHPAVSRVYFSKNRHPYIMLSVPLSNRTGVLAAKLDFEPMWQWISEVSIGETGHAFVVDRNGDLIAHPEPERVLAHSDFSSLPVVHDFLNQRQSSPDRWSEYRDEKGEKVVALYKSLPRLGWAVVTQIPAREVYAPIRRMHQNIVFWSLFWTAVFLVLGLRFVRRITHPLSALRDGVNRISRGDLDIRLDGIRTGDELQDLAGNVERMARALRELEAMREDLIRMIIHDLKSPLSGIMGSLDYLESGLLGDMNSDQLKIVSLAKSSSEAMLAMVQNLLDVAKMEEGRLELRREPTDLSALLADRRRQFEHLASNEKKSLSLEVAFGVPPVSADRGLIERVVNNLLSNAFNHTSSGGAIRIRLAPAAGGGAEVSVSDDGVGVPPEYRDRIFEKFVQVERRQAHLRTGAGLGLTFCKMAVEAHGGTIRVESEQGRGSSFVFTLPSAGDGSPEKEVDFFL